MRVKLAAATCALLFAIPCFSFAQAQQTPSAAPQQAQPAPQDSGRVHLAGNVIAAKLIHMVPPVYPEIAKVAHVSGTVVLHAIIAKNGNVQEITVISGPSLLRQAAIDAVKQWQYQTTLLNGEPVEVDTTVSVVFDLGGAPTAGSTGAVDTGTSNPVDPQLKASIVKLLDLTHAISLGQDVANSMFQQIRPQIIASLPPTPHREQIADAYGKKLAALLTSQ
ncbi:MAG: energy transducer TonB, partial [Candidatus Acidiferrales bacterium]